MSRLRVPIRDREDTRRRPEPVKVLTVDPRVWQHALSLADGNVRRMILVSSSEVIVSNNEVRR